MKVQVHTKERIDMPRSLQSLVTQFYSAKIGLVDFVYNSALVEVVEEVPRQSFSEYLAMVGGDIGLWNGASLLSIGHLVVLVGRALFQPPFFRHD